MNTRYADGRFILALTVALLTGSAISLLAHPPDAGTVKMIAWFDAAKLETPESIAILPDGTKYISLALTGEIRKIAPVGGARAGRLGSRSHGALASGGS
jgi:hypothetical protein